MPKKPGTSSGSSAVRLKGTLAFAGENLQTNRPRMFLINKAGEMLTIDDLKDIHPDLEEGDDVEVLIIRRSRPNKN